MKKNIPVKYIFAAIWFALLALLFSMFGFAHLGHKLISTILILTFALVQMLATLFFFMRLRQSAKLIWIFAVAGFFWFLFLVTLTASDYLTRQWH